MRIIFWKSGKSMAAGDGAAGAAAVGNRITQRAFLKTIAAAAAGFVAAPVLMPAKRAEATYTPGSPADIVNTNLTVQGNLVVGPTGGSSMAVGTSTIQGKLNVAGDVWVNGTQAIGTDGVIKQSYYAP